MNDHISAWTVGNRIYVRSPYALRFKMKGITGGRWDSTKKAWHYPRSHRTLNEIMKTLPSPVALSEDLLTMLEEGDPYEQAAEIREATDLPNPPVCNGNDWLHQRRAYWWAKNLPAILLDMWMGSGKTRTAINIIQNWYPEGNAKVLVACPPNVVPVWEEQIATHAAVPWEVTLLPAGKSTAKRAEIAEQAIQRVRPGTITCLVCNYEGVWRGALGDWVLSQQWDAVVADECVVEGTQIATPDGNISIEDLKIGDNVWGWDEQTQTIVPAKVTHTFSRITEEPLYSVDELVCTGNHPIWTPNGYIKAENFGIMTPTVLKLTSGGVEHVQAEVRMVRKGIRSKKTDGERKTKKVLQQKLLGKMEDVETGIRCETGYPQKKRNLSGENEAQLAGSEIRRKITKISSLRQKPIQEPGNRGKNQKKGSGDVKGENWILFSQWWQWQEAPISTKVIGGAPRMENGIPCSNEATSRKRVSVMLQDRHSRSCFENRDRSGWGISRIEKKTSPRQEENRIIGIYGMENSAVHEFRNSGRSERSIEKGDGVDGVNVYNIETTTGNYFAEGIMVHNCHHLKSPGSKQSLFFAKLHKKAKRRLGLTGTPLHDGPLDIYGQARFLVPEVFGTSFANFRSRYARMGGYGGYQVLGYQNLEEFYEKYRSFTYTVGPDEALPDLPPILFERRTCTLNREEMKVYSSLEHDLMAQVKDGTVSVNNALTKLIKLQQVTSGYVRDDDSTDHYVGDSKRKLLADVLSDLPKDEPVVVFCRFTHDLQAVHEVAKEDGRQSFELSGARKELQEWTRSEGGAVIAVQLRSGGEGIPMYKSRYVVDYSLSFSLGEYNQTRSRLQRPEQTRQVISIALVAEGTVDEQIYRALKRKEDVVKSIMEDYKGGVTK